MKTIGFLCDGIHGDWSYRSWAGMRSEAAKRGYRLLMLDGGVLPGPDQPPRPENCVYQLAGNGGLDGVIVWKPSISYGVPEAAFQTFLDQLQCPVVTIEGRSPGIPWVDLDTRQGMTALMEHLYGDHGFRRFGFVGLHENHEGFRRRYTEFSRFLHNHGLVPVTAALKPFLAEGSEQSSGRISPEQAGPWLVPALAAGIDVLVCVSDWVASQLLIALNSLGYQVPHDVALVGFDDSRHSSWIDPPLTTVGGSWETLGAQALAVAAAQLEGETVTGETLIPMHLASRESCGCDFLSTSLSRPSVESDLDLSEQLFRLAVSEQCPEPRALARELADAWSSPTDGDGTAFLRVLQRWLERGVRHVGPFAPWQGLLALLFQHPYRNRQGPQTALEMKAYALVAHFGDRSTGYLLYSNGQISLGESELDLALITCRDRDELHRLLEVSLSRLDIAAWFLMVPFEDHSPWMAVDSGLPHWVVQPLVADGVALGYMAYQSGTVHDMRLTGITKRVAQALVSMDQRKKIEEHARILEQALNRLQETSQQLIQSEKVGAVGTLVRGLAHQLNTPVGNALTAATLQQSLLTGVRRSSPSETDLWEEHLGSLEATNTLIVNSVHKTAAIIERIRQLSDRPSGRAEAPFPLGRYCRTLLKTLQALPCDAKVTWTLEATDTLVFACSPEVFGQVLTNLVSNSLEHGFSGRDRGHITLKLAMDTGGGLVWSYTDDGVGIPEDQRSTLYLPFHTSMNSQKPGLGTFLIHSLVTQSLGGTIEASFPGEGGVCFEIRLPAPSRAPSPAPFA